MIVWLRLEVEYKWSSKSGFEGTLSKTNFSQIVLIMDVWDAWESIRGYKPSTFWFFKEALCIICFSNKDWAYTLSMNIHEISVYLLSIPYTLLFFMTTTLVLMFRNSWLIEYRSQFGILWIPISVLFWTINLWLLYIVVKTHDHLMLF